MMDNVDYLSGQNISLLFKLLVQEGYSTCMCVFGLENISFASAAQAGLVCRLDRVELEQ